MRHYFFRHKSYNSTWHIVVVAVQWENRSSVDGPMERARLTSDYCNLIYIDTLFSRWCILTSRPCWPPRDLCKIVLFSPPLLPREHVWWGWWGKYPCLWESNCCTIYWNYNKLLYFSQRAGVINPCLQLVLQTVYVRKERKNLLEGGGLVFRIMPIWISIEFYTFIG